MWSILLLIIIASINFIGLFVIRMRLEIMKATVKRSNFLWKIFSCGRVRNKEAFIQEHKIGMMNIQDEVTLDKYGRESQKKPLGLSIDMPSISKDASEVNPKDVKVKFVGIGESNESKDSSLLDQSSYGDISVNTSQNKHSMRDRPMTIYDMFMNIGGTPVAEEDRTYTIWGTTADKRTKIAQKGGILKKKSDFQSKLKSEEPPSPNASAVSAFSKRRGKVQFSFRESEGIEEEKEEEQYEDFDALEEIEESNGEEEEEGEEEGEDEEEDPDEISDDDEMAFDQSKLSNVSFDMIQEKEKEKQQVSSDITGGGRDQNYIVDKMNDTHKKDLSEDSMESVRSENSAVNKNISVEKVDDGNVSDSDDGNAGSDDDKDGSFISDMLPKAHKYEATDRERPFEELDESNIDIDD